MGQTKIVVCEDVMKGLEAVRLSGKTNMLDAPMVAHLALEMGFSETAFWIDENRSLYAQGVFMGFQVEIDQERRW